MHDDVAVLEQEAALVARGRGDPGDGRARVLGPVEQRRELARVAVAGVVAGERAAVLDVERAQLRGRLAVGITRPEGQCDPDRDDAGGGDRERQYDARVQSSFLPILNLCVPVDVLPLMSVAIQRNVVVLVRWNVCPGSRGPVESHSGELDVGLRPSIV